VNYLFSCSKDRLTKVGYLAEYLNSISNASHFKQRHEIWIDVAEINAKSG